jgi:hypothetical protein
LKEGGPCDEKCARALLRSMPRVARRTAAEAVLYASSPDKSWCGGRKRCASARLAASIVITLASQSDARWSPCSREPSPCRAQSGTRKVSRPPSRRRGTSAVSGCYSQESKDPVYIFGGNQHHGGHDDGAHDGSCFYDGMIPAHFLRLGAVWLHPKSGP